MTADVPVVLLVIVIVVIVAFVVHTVWDAWPKPRGAEMKYRIVESDDGQFYPQFKDGWLSRWHGFKTRAETAEHPTLVVWLTEDDPAKAAKFTDERRALVFIDRVKANAEAGWREHNESKRRTAEGVSARKVTRVD